MLGIRKSRKNEDQSRHAKIGEFRVAIFNALVGDFHLVLGFLLDQPETTTEDAERYKANAALFKEGIELVFIGEIDAFSETIRAKGEMVSAGAMIANAALGVAYSSGVHNPDYKNDLLNILSR
jgi:hypothetical protein